MAEPKGWQTTRELDYLQRLPAGLLPGYLEGARRRTDWAEIDKEEVIAQALALLHRAVDNAARIERGRTWTM